MVSRICVIFVILLSLAISAHALAGDRVTFDVTLDPSIAAQPVTGRLFVLLTQRDNAEPRFGPNWFHPEPFAGLDVQQLAPGQQQAVDDAADAFPAPPSQWSAGRYRAQALLDRDLDHHHPGKAPGNLFSDAAEISLPDSGPVRISLVLDHVIEADPFPESDSVHEVVIKSECLSQFHGREIIERAAVVLPASYRSSPDRRYPVLYIIPGFGGSHRDALQYTRTRRPADEGEVELIRVMLSGDCKWGHHVYADSATNGPRGRALVSETIPQIDHRYRTIPAPTARFVSGHSSGGWAALWLQVTYPEVFGGAWSTAPDPVDFRDFQQVNLYADPTLSLYVDPNGARRPIARSGDTPSLWFDSFGKMDDVIKRGGQLRSFEAVFSPRHAGSEPLHLWDRASGRIDPAVAKAWETYDIRLVIQRNWPTLGPQLAGKLHIWTGDLDTFYLDGAVKLLKSTLEALGSDAQVTIVPGANHSSLLNTALRQTIRRQMSAKFLEHYPAALGSR